MKNSEYKRDQEMLITETNEYGWGYHHGYRYIEQETGEVWFWSEDSSADGPYIGTETGYPIPLEGILYDRFDAVSYHGDEDYINELVEWEPENPDYNCE